MFKKRNGLIGSLAALAIVFGAVALSVSGSDSDTPGLTLVGEHPMPGLVMEISGIHPDPQNAKFYYAAANKTPAYKNNQSPKLGEEFRGKLLKVEVQSGEIVKAFDLVEGNYGGIAFGNGALFVSSLQPPEILRVNPETGAIEQRIPTSGPIGGLEFEKERGLLMAQLYVGYPHLAVIDPKSGATLQTLWSDESAMDLSKVGSDWLCTWVSGFDHQAFSELRLLDEQTGYVKGRVRLDKIHTSMAPIEGGIMSMVTTNPESGAVNLRTYGYSSDEVNWVK